MNAFDRNPRLLAIAMIILGAAALALVAAIGGGSTGRTGTRILFIVGIGGIALGAGLPALLWPPPPRQGESDERNFFKRSSWPQKILFVVCGFLGIVAGAILHVWANGGI